MSLVQEYYDSRGDLCVLNNFTDIPFEIKRIFWVCNVPSPQIMRGGHAHKKCHQYLLCLVGKVDIVYENHEGIFQTCLVKNQGVHLPPMTWATQQNWDSETILMVLTSELYDPDDYISSFEEFKFKLTNFE